MKARFIKRDRIVDGALIAALCKQHMLMLGPSGTATSMLAQPSARANWHRCYLRYLDPSRGAPPSLAMHGVPLPERFLTSDVAPVSQRRDAGCSME